MGLAKGRANTFTALMAKLFPTHPYGTHNDHRDLVVST